MEDEIRLKMQSQTNSQLVDIIDNPKKWSKAIVQGAEYEINRRGGLDAVEGKLEAGEDDSTITVAERQMIETAQQKNSYIYYAIVLIFVLAITLPFHYVLVPDFTVFPKDNLSFSNTFILPSDINRMVEKHNNRNLRDLLLDKDEPLTRKLIEKGIIKQK